MKYYLRNTIGWKFIKRNLLDFFEGFLPFDPLPEVDPQKKRILIFNWRDTRHAYSGGAEVYLHEIAKRVVQDGNHVTLFCGSDTKSQRNEIIDGVQIVRRGGFYFVYIWAFFYYMMHFRGKYDVIIDSQNGIPFFTPLYVKEPVYSLLFHIHQEVFRKSLIRPLAYIATFLEQKCMPMLYKNTPFLTISKSSQEEITSLDLGRKGTSIIYPGVDLINLTPQKKSSSPMVLYLGRLKYYKRVDVLLRSAKEILETHPSVQFVIAGDGEYKKNLKKLAARLGIEKNVEFVGKVTEDEKRDLYGKAWVVVNPSMMEGWGITTIEANACGTPVIASDVPGLRDSVRNGHTGYLFPLGNSQELAVKIKNLLSNPTLLRKMGKSAHIWAEKYDWAISAEKFSQVIAQKRRSPSVSIGIPAFNEAGNIKNILTSLLAQKEEGYILKEIVVVSDGSTDKTVAFAKKIKDTRIRVVADSKRLGKSARINQLFSELQSDIQFLVDADIAIHDTSLLSKVIKGSDISRTGIVTVQAKPTKARNFFEKCINHSVLLQNDIRKHWNSGNNYLSFRGCFLAIHKSLARNMGMSDDVVNNDAFLYFQAKKKGYLPFYIPELEIEYSSPSSLSDHIKQSSRFQFSKNELSILLDQNLDQEYATPKSVMLRAMVKYFFKNPVLFSGYLFIFVRTKFSDTSNLKSAWNIAVSTKSIHSHEL